MFDFFGLTFSNAVTLLAIAIGLVSSLRNRFIRFTAIVVCLAVILFLNSEERKQRHEEFERQVAVETKLQEQLDESQRNSSDLIYQNVSLQSRLDEGELRQIELENRVDYANSRLAIVQASLEASDEDRNRVFLQLIASNAELRDLRRLNSELNQSNLDLVQEIRSSEASAALERSEAQDAIVAEARRLNEQSRREAAAIERRRQRERNQDLCAENMGDLMELGFSGVRKPTFGVCCGGDWHEGSYDDCWGGSWASPPIILSDD